MKKNSTSGQKSNPWQKLSSRLVYQNPWLKLREDKVIRPDGKDGIYSVLEMDPAVSIIALNEKNEVYLVGLYRYTTDQFSWELPTGGSGGEDPLQAAQRELKEETGLEATKWQHIGSLQSFNGCSSEIQHIFLAQELVQTLSHQQKEEGISQIKLVPFEEVTNMIQKNEITDAQSIAAFFKAILWLKGEDLAR